MFIFVLVVCPDEPFSSCGFDLAVMINELTFRREYQVRAVQRTVSIISFCHTDAYISFSFGSRFSYHLRFFTRHHYGVVIVHFPVITLRFITLADRETECQSQRIARDERFRKYYQFSPFAACFFYYVYDFFRRCFFIKQYRRRLNNSNSHIMNQIFHNIFSFQTAGVESQPLITMYHKSVYCLIISSHLPM